MNTKTTLDLNLLVTLEALLIEQNVTKAAHRLHLSQPAVSAQLRRLRALFDDPLLIPLQRGMAPTSKALELLEPLRRSLDQLRSQIIGLLNAPATKIAGVLQAPAGQLARVFNAYATKDAA